jgi:hypothetical protein
VLQIAAGIVIGYFALVVILRHFELIMKIVLLFIAVSIFAFMFAAAGGFI